MHHGPPSVGTRAQSQVVLASLIRTQIWRNGVTLLMQLRGKGWGSLNHVVNCIHYTLASLGASVMHPSEAEVTLRAYLASTPRAAAGRGGGCTHRARRCASSSSASASVLPEKSMTRRCASISNSSPSCNYQNVCIATQVVAAPTHLNQPQRSATGRFGYDVANDEAM